jgi:hypothetical protein
MASIRVPSMIIRIAAVLALALGIVFWTGNLDNLQVVHMSLGILLVLALWWLAGLSLRRGGNPALAILAILDGAALYVVGVTQDNVLGTSPQWIIQVVHVTLALAAIGLGEVLAGRMTRAAKQAVA